MKKKIVPVLIAILTVSLINTGLLAFLAFDKFDGVPANKKPVVISKDYDKGQTMEKALATGKPIIVWFYTDWCGFCQKLAPTFKKVTKSSEIKNKFAVAYVNCENPENKKLMEEYNVEGYPTVYLVNGEKKELVSSLNLFARDAKDSLKSLFLAFLR
ncbi:MAG: thioredoxin domain-containing protein [Candidatus Gastranaerophilales bacterium]|nr:thioredoxin domain-containing protein [Candidatus Gastranaerophilales bacterium]